MTTKLRYQMTRDELIEEALHLHLQRFPLVEIEVLPIVNPRIDHLQQTFQPFTSKERPPLVNPRIDYLIKRFSNE